MNQCQCQRQCEVKNNLSEKRFVQKFFISSNLFQETISVFVIIYFRQLLYGQYTRTGYHESYSHIYRHKRYNRLNRHCSDQGLLPGFDTVHSEIRLNSPGDYISVFVGFYLTIPLESSALIYKQPLYLFADFFISGFDIYKFTARHCIFPYKFIIYYKCSMNITGICQ